MVILGDPQYPWDCAKGNANCDELLEFELLTTCSKSLEVGNDYRLPARLANASVVQAINWLDSRLPDFRGSIINGDLTAFGHDWQWEYIQFQYGLLDSPMFLGLGNHDYEINVNDCYSRDTWDGCAIDSIENLLANVTRNGLRNELDSLDLDWTVDGSDHRGSLAYSWEMGEFHFVQLHNHPGYAVERVLEEYPDWTYNDLAPWDYHTVPAAMGCKDWFTAKVKTNGELEAAMKTAEAADTASYIEVVAGKHDYPAAGHLMHGRLSEIYGI